MKVLVVMPYYLPHMAGLEKHVNTILQSLRERYGHEFVVITSNHISKEDIIDTYDGIKVYRLKTTFKIANTPIGLDWKGKIEKILLSEKPDIVNGRGPSPYIADIACSLAKKHNIPFVLGWHFPSMIKGNSIYDPIIWFYESTFFKLMIKNSKQIICSAENVKRTLLNDVSEKTTVITQGIDKNLFRQKNLDKKSHSLVFIGSFDLSVKGLKYILEAMVKLKSEFNDINLTVAGPGDKSIFTKYSNDNELNVSFIGTTVGQKLVDQLNRHQILICPSIKDNFPSTVLEALHCGLPVIATNVGSIPEAIVHGENGYLVTPKDCEEIAKYIRNIFIDGNLYKKLSQGALASMTGKYEWDKQVELNNNVFNTAYTT